MNKTTESEKERCRHYVEIFYTSDLHRCTYVRTKLPLTTAYVEYVGGTETLEGYLKRRTKGKSLGRCMLSLRSSNSFSCGLSSRILRIQLPRLVDQVRLDYSEKRWVLQYARLQYVRLQYMRLQYVLLVFGRKVEF